MGYWRSTSVPANGSGYDSVRNTIWHQGVDTVRTTIQDIMLDPDTDEAVKEDVWQDLRDVGGAAFASESPPTLRSAYPPGVWRGPGRAAAGGDPPSGRGRALAPGAPARRTRDGFSCRGQIEDLTARRGLHLAQVVRMAMAEPAGREERAATGIAGGVGPWLAVGAGLIGGWLLYRSVIRE